ncbi:hypothetical protein CH063_15657 [Colletotrichum higginsianum]|uniref:Uncharacterized protein n=1 Tax=Colletotrichum higginsianum (strain IMI 349063) TaxID=759273 RepID=H1W3U6_COLHI|nr:hypothetical protein CH063_15657 [Colletotrichum higginsianum]
MSTVPSESTKCCFHLGRVINQLTILESALSMVFDSSPGGNVGIGSISSPQRRHRSISSVVATTPNKVNVGDSSLIARMLPCQ